MDFQEYFDSKNYQNSQMSNFIGLWAVSGSFGTIDGKADYTVTTNKNVTTYEYATENVTLKSEFTKERNGVVVRKDYFTNLTDKPITINKFLNRYYLLASIIAFFCHPGSIHGPK